MNDAIFFTIFYIKLIDNTKSLNKTNESILLKKIKYDKIIQTKIKRRKAYA